MTKLVSISLVTASFWILHKSGTECVQLLSQKDEVFRSHKREKNNSFALPANYDEAVSFRIEGSRSSLLEEFVTCFTQRILSSDRLAEMYDTSLPPQEAEEAHYRIIFNAETNVHTEDARRITLIVSSAIGATFDKLTLPQHVQAYGYSIGKFMITVNVLTRENLNEFCDSYVRYNKMEASYVPQIPDKSLVHIQAISNSLVHITGSLGIYTPDTVKLISQYFADFLYEVTGVPRAPPKDPRTDNNEVDIFADEFTRLILASPKLAEIYDTSLTPELAEEAYNRVVYNAVFNVHTYDPSGVSQICSDAIRDTFGSLNSTQHVQVHGFAAAKYLKSKNVLTRGNVHELVNSFLTYVEEAVKNVPLVPDRRDAFIQAVSDGCVHFMISLNRFTSDGVILLAQQFANSLYDLTGIPNTRSYEPPSCSRI